MIAIFLLFVAGMRPFRRAFIEKFGRSFIHWENISVMVVWLFSVICHWTAVGYICWIVLIIIGILQIRKYGFGWGLGVWTYNVLTLALVLTVINTIMDMTKENKK